MAESSYAMGVLLKQASDGEQKAWMELVNRYTNLLWSVARSFRLDSADAADAVQTTWLRLVEHLGRIEDPDRLVGWLVTTLRRECIRILRRNGRERPGADEEALDVPDPSEPVDAGLLREERDAALWRAFGQLGDRCQQLLRVLMASPKPQYEVVSDALNMPIGSIGPTRARCLKNLRGLLEQSGYVFRSPDFP